MSRNPNYTNGNESDDLEKAVRKLSQYDEWATVVRYVESVRESRIQNLAANQTEYLDAKVVGAIVNADDILSVLKNH